MTKQDAITISDFHAIFRKFSSTLDRGDLPTVVPGAGADKTSYTVTVKNDDAYISFTSARGANVDIQVGTVLSGEVSISFRVNGAYTGGLCVHRSCSLAALDEQDPRLLSIAMDAYAAVKAHIDAAVEKARSERRLILDGI
jgi:hypothetical protein